MCKLVKIKFFAAHILIQGRFIFTSLHILLCANCYLIVFYFHYYYTNYYYFFFHHLSFVICQPYCYSNLHLVVLPI